MKPLARTFEVALGLLTFALGCDRAPGPLGPNALNPRAAVAARAEPPVGSWSPLASMSTARFGLAAATGSNGIVYAIGGSTGLAVTTVVSTVEAYDPTTDRWSAVAPMPSARRYLMAATDRHGRIYAIGGAAPPALAGFRNTVQRYDPQTDSWATVAPLPAPRCCGAVATGRDGRIYVAGGFNVQGQIGAVDAYDPESDAWESVAPLPSPLAGGPATAAWSNGLIYVMGGITGINTIPTVRRYDPCADTWATVASMPTPRRFTDAVLSRGGQIYVLGGTVGSVGFPGTQVLAVAERYDPVSDTWATTAPLTTPRGALAAAVGPRGSIFAIGGYDGSRVLSSAEAFTPGPSDVSDRGVAPGDGSAIAPRCGEGHADVE